MEKKPYPLTAEGEADKEAVKKLFNKSRFIRWHLFCDEYGFDPDRGYALFPVAQWIREKRFQVAQDNANELQEMLDEIRPKISQDILKTLRDYPKAHDDLLKLLDNTRIALNNEMAEYVRRTAAAREAGQNIPELRKGFVMDLSSLTMAITQLTSSKHRSLLLNNVTFKAFEEKVLQESNLQIDEAKPTGNPLTFEVIGFENAGAKELDELFQQYVDKPQRKLTPEEIEVSDESN